MDLPGMGRSNDGVGGEGNRGIGVEVRALRGVETVRIKEGRFIPRA